MANDPLPPCSHCGADGVIESLMRFYCVECGWWGPAADKMIYEPDGDEDYRPEQAPRRPTE